MLRFVLISLCFFVPLSFTGFSIQQTSFDSLALPRVVTPSVYPNALDTINVPDGTLLARAEGCTDSFVVPPNPSGPTVSCGIDLGAIGTANAVRIFDGIVSDTELATIVAATRIRGPRSLPWVRKNQIHLRPGASEIAFRRARALMWSGVRGTELSNLPPAVQSALLSYVYHTGHLPSNTRKLKSMSPHAIAQLLRGRGAIYVGSNTKAFKRRRSLEAKYIEQCCSDALAVCLATICLPSS